MVQSNRAECIFHFKVIACHPVPLELALVVRVRLRRSADGELLTHVRGGLRGQNWSFEV